MRLTLRYLSLFTGGAGLDMAVHTLFPDARPVAVCENAPGPSRLLEARLPDVPNLADVTSANWSELGEVDLIVGGFPCQDISHAGRRAGIIEGETRSGLWFNFRDAIRTLRPRLVLVENVAAITAAGGGLDVVLGSLAEIGYDATWGCLRASDVGACHRRDRWFAIAHPADADLSGLEGRDAGGVRRGAGERAAGQDDPRPGVTPSTLLPTPAVNDMGEGKSVEWWDQWTEDLRARHGNGNGHGKSLAIEAQRLLPTPRTSDTNGAGAHGDGGMGLRTAAALLPTPRVHADRTSRSALTRDGHWSAPSLAQAVELASGVLPREYESWGEVQGWHGRMLPTPTAVRGRNETSGRKPDAQFNTGTTLNDVAYADRWGDYAPAIARWEPILGRLAPSPVDAKGRLSPAFVEWMMGWPEGWTDLDGISRNQALKILGNGVVPQQAIAAYSQLLGRIVAEVAA